MTVPCKFRDGGFDTIQCVMWHPASGTMFANPEGLWAIAKNVESWLAKSGRKLEDIEFAEAPVTLYLDSDDHEPWKHAGLMVKEIQGAVVPYGWWNMH